MAVDLDRYADPPGDEATLAGRRLALIEQLGWLESEAAALAPLLAALPEWAIRQAPLPTDLSAAETFAAFAHFDRHVVSVWLDAVERGSGATLVTPSPLVLPAGAADGTLESLLTDVQAARAALRRRLDGLDPEVWSRPVSLDGTATTLYGALLALCQRDADALRALAYRLYEADLGRPADRPPSA